MWIKEVVIKHILHLIASSVSKEVTKDGGQVFEALDPDKKQPFHVLVASD